LGMCLASFPNRSRPRRRRRPRLFFVWLVQANLSRIAFSIQTLTTLANRLIPNRGRRREGFEDGAKHILNLVETPG
jgi:hypothetical protein